MKDSKRRLVPWSSAVVMVGLTAMCAPAAELFPYNPPPNAPSASQGIQQAPVGPAFQLSGEDNEKIARFASMANQLPTDAKAHVRSGVQESLDKAVQQRDWQRASYYSALLQQIK